MKTLKLLIKKRVSLTRSSAVAETALCFVNFNILLCHSRSLKVN